MIQNVMETITKEVEAEGQPSPLFHVFSETKDGCPSETSGTFPEFPTWTLEPDEVRTLREKLALNPVNSSDTLNATVYHGGDPSIENDLRVATLLRHTLRKSNNGRHKI